MNEEVPHGEKDQGQGGPEAEVGVRAGAERARPSTDLITQKVRNLTRRAGLRHPEADVRSVDFFEGRGLDRVVVAELATCGFVGRGENVVLQGLTGTGKTCLTCALAKAACARGTRGRATSGSPTSSA